MMTESDWLFDKYKQTIAVYFNERLATDEDQYITEDDVYVVNHMKIGNKSRALVSTTVPDGMYYMVTVEIPYACEVDDTIIQVAVLKKNNNKAIPTKATSEDEFVSIVKDTLSKYYVEKCECDLDEVSVEILAFTWILGNIKVLASLVEEVIDGETPSYVYEITYNKDKNEMYLDEYIETDYAKFKIKEKDEERNV